MPAEPEIQQPVDPAKMHARYKELIGKWINRDGIFSEVLTTEDGEDAGNARVFVTPKFFALDADSQWSYLRHIYTYAFGDSKTMKYGEDSEKDNMIMLRDERTRRSVGYFTLLGGLKLHAPSCWPYC